jgi:hypothetical protein
MSKAFAEKFVIPIFKKRGIIDSNNKINPDAARAAGYQVTQTSPPKAPSFNTDSQGRLVSNLTGKPPTIVDAPTTDIKTTSQKKETSNEKSIAKAKRIGRKYTILTSPEGLANNFKTTKKTLLGG